MIIWYPGLEVKNSKSSFSPLRKSKALKSIELIFYVDANFRNKLNSIFKGRKRKYNDMKFTSFFKRSLIYF